MPILIKSAGEGGIEEWAIIEMQGDLVARDDEDIENLFVGDLYYNKFGQPIMIIGHHMLTGREQKIEKPYAVLEKTKTNEGVSLSDTTTTDAGEVSTLNATVDQTLLDTTAAIENKSAQRTEYKVRALVTKKLLFKSRPKPIIANVPDTV
ncbi:chromosome transmission fidelity protein 8 homolog [Episyrphus balteatus]|uniref:chromosome transmission fidelity protein 8 homolog n=1 Tax=Episyrphus balteatus TaxID=286459 RepID=UPI002486C65C|nr:chromosome transmission fidelity protein 8 homolog [Episyrphus balteatus]